jgi:hypothetical protein
VIVLEASWEGMAENGCRVCRRGESTVDQLHAHVVVIGVIHHDANYLAGVVRSRQGQF